MLILILIVHAEFNDWSKHRSKDCKEVIRAANNRPKSKNVVALLLYDPIYRHTICARLQNLSNQVFSRRTLRAELRIVMPSARIGLNPSSGHTTPPPHASTSFQRGSTSSSFSHTSQDPLDNDEEERDEAVKQLILNRNQCRVTPVVKLEVASLFILILSSGDEHSDNLAQVPLRVMSGTEILHLFGKVNSSDIRFKNMNKKAL